MAMGQRGMYLAVSPVSPSEKAYIDIFQMLDHSGMLNAAESRIDIDQCRHEPERAWEDWKEHEGKHR